MPVVSPSPSFVKIDPPGTWCQNSAIFDMLKRFPPPGKRFLEVGCGAGDLSRHFLAKGYTGIGLDLSEEAVRQARANLADFITAGRYQVIQGSPDTWDDGDSPFDLAASIMVMEHVADDIGFVRSILRHVRPGGLVLLGVPGRMDYWGIEDETVGHIRRYEKDTLRHTLEQAGLQPLDIWSASVPVANLLHQVSNRFISQSQAEMDKLQQAQAAQTLQSGIREIPYKTVFPKAFKLILNRHTMKPLMMAQRLFYQSNMGITLLACGRRVDGNERR